MAVKLIMICTLCTALMFRFPVLGRPLGLVVGISIAILVLQGWLSMFKAMIKFFNYLQDSEIQK